MNGKFEFPSVTRRYKGCWIHQAVDGSITWQTPDYRIARARSWRAAQLAITRHLGCRKMEV